MRLQFDHDLHSTYEVGLLELEYYSNTLTIKAIDSCMAEYHRLETLVVPFLTVHYTGKCRSSADEISDLSRMTNSLMLAPQCTAFAYYMSERSHYSPTILPDESSLDTFKT